jgi:3-oxoacyl-(acyl-carrier-protein) synthase
MALFAQYAMCSAAEALQDANWMPKSEEDLQATVRWQNINAMTENNAKSIYRVFTLDLV